MKRCGNLIRDHITEKKRSACFIGLTSVSLLGSNKGISCVITQYDSDSNWILNALLPPVFLCIDNFMVVKQTERNLKVKPDL